MKRFIYRKSPVLRTVLIFSGLFLFFFVALMIFANWPAFKNNVSYDIHPPAATPAISPLPTVSSPSTSQLLAASISTPNRIMISKIRVNAPISWDIAPEDTPTYLSKGVVHLKGTAKPGEVGNFFLLGHSSDYIWKRNPYAAVFSLLPKLKVGDTIQVFDSTTEYVYQVSGTKIVTPYQVEVANPTPTATMTLMTCYPVGTSQNRLIVTANLISPAPKPQTMVNGVPQISGIKFR